MIFVCLGTQIFQFNRLVEKLDDLVRYGYIKEEIVAQIGATDYIPQNFFFKRYMDKPEFEEYLKKADLIITHGGTGAIISASKLGKNIIAIPRLAKYKEHVDDHQLQIVDLLSNKGYIRAVYNMDDLICSINEAKKNPIHKVYNRKSCVIKIIEKFINEI